MALTATILLADLAGDPEEQARNELGSILSRGKFFDGESRRHPIFSPRSLRAAAEVKNKLLRLLWRRIVYPLGLIKDFSGNLLKVSN